MLPIGNYNPHSPIILGQEWVPIRDEDTTFTPTVNTVEVGHTFELAASRTITQARVYVHEIPPTADDGQNIAVALYAAGTEDQSGPVRSIIIPANAIVLTGGSVDGGTDALTAISTPADDGISFTPTAGTVQGARLSFAVGQYATALAGKRILDVRFLYAGEVSRTDTTIGLIAITPDTGLGPLWTDELNLARFVADNDSEIFAADLGELNYWWNGSPTGTAEYMPWQIGQLQRFDTTAQKLYAVVACGTAIGNGPTVDDFLFLQYMAMEVFYCDEKRLAYGDLRFGQPFTGNLQLSGRRAIYGANTMTMRDMNAYGSSPVIPAGNYVVTASSPNNGESGFSSLVGYPELNAVQQLYPIPPHPGVQVNIPFPLADRLGDTFVSKQTPILPQISLHTASGVMVEPHAYGRQAAAQIWGANTATQDIYDDVSGVAASYPQVRYYARRFGDTSIPLTLTGSGALAGSTVQITVADFDALTDILDGWKEVTLRFAVAPTMGAVTGAPGWTWSAPGEIVGNRWEILAASAPALSGTPGNYYNQVPIPNALGPATYQASTAAAPTPTLISAGTDTSGNNASVVPGFPTGLAPGQTNVTLLVFAAIRNSGTGTVDVPAGYTQIFASGNMALLGKIWNGVEGAPTITFSNGAALATTSAQMAAFSDLPLSVIQSSGQLNGSAQNIAYPGITTSRDTMFMWLGWKQDDWTNVNTLGGTTEIGDFSSTLGDDQGLVWAYASVAGGLAVSAGSFTVNGGASAISRGALIAFDYTSVGAEIELTWMPQGVASVYVTGATPDPATDAVLIFSQDPPTVTGLSLTQRTQVVSGIGLDCGSLPCCIPSGIGYNRVAWSLPNGSLQVGLSAFGTPVVSGWGSDAYGTAWTPSGSADQYAVAGGLGLITPTTAGSDRFITLAGIGTNFDLVSQVGVQNVAVAGSSARGGLVGRYTDVNNHYLAQFQTAGTGGATTFLITKRVAGVASTIAGSVTLPFSINAGGQAWLRFMGDGTTLKAKIWVGELDAEPLPWNLEVTDTSLTTGTAAGAFARSETSTGNTMTFDNFSAGPPRWNFGALELQRWDAEQTDFQTIMLATDPGVSVFNDFEARVGINSVYRIRSLNALNFAGAYSTYVTGAPAAPGVSGGCNGEAGGALIFTSNADQTGANNAAYVMQWDGTPTEGFGLPEADMVTFQPMYGRDGSVAFHGTERGLETFDRAVLLHAAAIDPVKLADAATIRDLAWASLPYVCVRDDIGDRWFANIRIPDVTARMNRTKYMASIKIVETTRTPYPVDP